MAGLLPTWGTPIPTALPYQSRRLYRRTSVLVAQDSFVSRRCLAGTPPTSLSRYVDLVRVVSFALKAGTVGPGSSVRNVTYMPTHVVPGFCSRDIYKACSRRCYDLRIHFPYKCIMIPSMKSTNVLRDCPTLIFTFVLGIAAQRI